MQSEYPAKFWRPSVEHQLIHHHHPKKGDGVLVAPPTWSVVRRSKIWPSCHCTRPQNPVGPLKPAIAFPDSGSSLQVAALRRPMTVAR